MAVCLLFFLVLGCPLFGLVVGNSYYVGVNGTYANISQVIPLIQSGDVIYLSGNFSGANNRNFNLTGFLNLTIVGQGKDITFIDCGSSFFLSYFLVLDLTYRLLTLQGITFTNCLNVIQAQTGNMVISITNSKFMGSTASALFIQGEQPVNQNELAFSPIILSISSSDFLNNAATGVAPNFNGYGGAICAMYANLTCTNCTFSSNSATGFGGAVYIDQNSVFTNTNFLNNQAALGGGAVNNFGGVAIVTNSVISGNQDYGQGEGCGWRIDAAGILKCTQCVWQSNVCGQYGGAIALENGAGLTTYNNSFSGNKGLQGGGVYNSGGSQNHNNDTFLLNTAPAYGGAISIIGGYAWLQSVTIQSNIANGGGAIFLEYSSILMIGNSIITMNSAQNQAGGIYCTDSVVNLTQTQLSNNIAAGNPNFYCSNDVASATCTIYGNSGYSCPAISNPPFYSTTDITLIFLGCLLGLVCLGFCVSFFVYFSNKKNRIAQGFVWAPVVEED